MFDCMLWPLIGILVFIVFLISALVIGIVLYFIRGLVVDPTAMIQRRDFLNSQICVLEARSLYPKRDSHELRCRVRVLNDKLSFDAKNKDFSSSIVGFLAAIKNDILAVFTLKGWRRDPEQE